MGTVQIAELFGYAGTFIGIIMFIPQAYDIWKTKNTKGISLLSFLLMTLGCVFWIVYGILTSSFPVLIVNIVLITLGSYIIMMKLKYK